MPRNISLTYRDVRALIGPGGDVTAALQYAHDLVRDGGGGIVTVPPGDWGISGDVYWDSDHVELCGFGRNSSAIGFGPLGSILCGFPRRPGGWSPGAGHRLDLFGILDSTAAPTPGVRWGIRTHDPAAGTWGHATFGTSPWQFGRWLGYRPDYWTTIDTLTIDFGTYETGAFPVGQLFGCLDPFYRGAPLYAWFNGSDYWVQFATVDPDGTIVDRRIYLRGVSVPSGVQRCSLRIGVADGSIRAWYGRTQVAVDVDSIGDGWGSLPGRRFYCCQSTPFNLGTVSQTSFGWGNSESISGVAKLDRTFCGLRYTAGDVYADDGVGQPQRRLDGSPLTDLAQFFYGEPATFGVLDLTDGPADGRRAIVQPGPAGGVASRGLFVSQENDNISGYLGMGHGDIRNDAATFQRVADLTARATQYHWTPLITLGTVWSFAMERVRVERGGLHGVGAILTGNSFPVTFRDCSFHGTDAGLFLFAATAFLQNCEGNGTGRAGLRLLQCDAGIDQFFFANNADDLMDYAIACHRGAKVRIRGLSFDSEAVTGKPKGCFYVQARGEVQDDGLTIEDSAIGPTFTADVPLIVLDVFNAGDSSMSATLRVEGLNLQTPIRELIRNRTPGRTWTGTVKAKERTTGSFGIPGGVDYIVNDHDDAVGGIKVEMDHRDLPPTMGRWERNSFELRVPDPRPGQYSRWVGPVVGGTCGTPSPPEWAGVDPAGTGLAGYCLGRSYAVHQP